MSLKNNYKDDKPEPAPHKMHLLHVYTKQYTLSLHANISIQTVLANMYIIRSYTLYKQHISLQNCIFTRVLFS